MLQLKPTCDFSQSPASIRSVCAPEFYGQIGVARCDITPPLGIYSRMWGSAVHETAEGVHRPLSATILTLQSPDTAGPLVLASMDLCTWRMAEDEEAFRRAILDELGLESCQLLLHLTHTHSSPSLFARAAKPGAEKIAPYIAQMRSAIAAGVRQALDSARPATLTWRAGHCRLACRRDQFGPDGEEPVVGYVPSEAADDTLLVGRVADESGRILATLVNYACHPTSLGGANRLISPDYVGAMRDLVEQFTDGAPCLFLNGAAGDLAPRRQYAAHTEVADQNGRQLGYAVLATLDDMLPPQTALQFQGVERSSTNLGRWECKSRVANARLCHRELAVELLLRDRPCLAELERQRAATGDLADAERLTRLIERWRPYQDSRNAAFPVWLWLVGDAVFVATSAEMHSPFQIELRRRFPDRPIVVMNVVNGARGYLPPADDYPLNTYQCQISAFAAGGHETVLAACTTAIDRLLAETQSASALHQGEWRQL